MPPAAAGILEGVTAAGASGTAVGATAGASTASGAGTTVATTGGSLAATSGGGASGGDIAGSIMSGSSLSLDLNSFLPEIEQQAYGLSRRDEVVDQLRLVRLVHVFH